MPVPRCRFLIYKRTHLGDPEETQEFGCHDCMGRVRKSDYDVVIGVGSNRPRNDANHDFRPIRRRITWVGVGPHRRNDGRKRGPVVRFDEIYLPYRHWKKGIDAVESVDVSEVAPAISRRMFGVPDHPRHVRYVLNLTPEEYTEAIRILDLARRGGLDRSGKRSGAPANGTRRAPGSRRSCRKSKCRP